MASKLISHRGNINGVLKERENTPSYIDYAISLGYDVEIDVRYIDGKLYLGHDNPDTLIDADFLHKRSKKLWVHCKNIEALYRLIDSDINIFFHNVDEVVLTSHGFLWTYPGKLLTNRSICVLPEMANYSQEQLKSCFGICSDYIQVYKIN